LWHSLQHPWLSCSLQHCTTLNESLPLHCGNKESHSSSSLCIKWCSRGCA
jgi:hypothetical protein